MTRGLKCEAGELASATAAAAVSVAVAVVRAPAARRRAVRPGARHGVGVTDLDATAAGGSVGPSI
jgi:hypothetical protein